MSYVTCNPWNKTFTLAPLIPLICLCRKCKIKVIAQFLLVRNIRFGSLTLIKHDCSKRLHLLFVKATNALEKKQ